MRVIFNNDADSVLKSLYKKHIEDDKPLDAEACIFMSKLSKNVLSLEGPLLGTQRTMLKLQSDYVRGKGPQVRPLFLSTVPSSELTVTESDNCIKDIIYENGISPKSSVETVFNLLMPMNSEKEILYAIQFFYAFITLGTGERHAPWVEPPVN